MGTQVKNLRELPLNLAGNLIGSKQTVSLSDDEVLANASEITRLRNLGYISTSGRITRVAGNVSFTSGAGIFYPISFLPRQNNDCVVLCYGSVTVVNKTSLLASGHVIRCLTRQLASSGGGAVTLVGSTSLIKIGDVSFNPSVATWGGTDMHGISVFFATANELKVSYDMNILITVL